MATPPPPPIANLDEAFSDPDYVLTRPRKGKYQSQLGLLGKMLSTKGIGINVTAVPAQSAAFPKHYHYVADEMFIILSGTGTLHYGDADYPVKPNDVIYIQGGLGIPFQIDNTSDSELRYLALSSMEQADVFHYPESGKFGVMANGVPFRDLSDGEGLGRYMEFIRGDAGVDYYDGDPNAED